MAFIDKIISLQNQKLKSLVALRSRKGRRSSGQFLVEGAREISRALQWNFVADEFYACPPLLSPEAKLCIQSLNRISTVNGYELDEKCFAKAAIREGSDGLIGVFQTKTRQIQDLDLGQSPVILVVENIEKPGNLGAVLRSADGSGVDAVVIVGNSVDIYNQNTIRTSVGSVFSLPVIESCSNEDLLKFFVDTGFTSYGAALEDRSVRYDRASYKESSAIVLGNEATGLSEFWLNHCDHLVKIPMQGTADSLNVSVAGAVLMYEVLRQKSLR